MNAQGERREERKVEAQEGHEEAKEVTTQDKCVEAKKETNSMYEESDVSRRHVTWWKNAWWIRVNSGPHMRTARGRRRIWRAARRAAEQARDGDRVEETLSPAEEAEGETWGRKKWEQGRTRREEKQHIAHRAALAWQRNSNNYNNSSNHDRGSSSRKGICSRSNAFAMNDALMTVVEKTTTGVFKLKELVTKGELLLPLSTKGSSQVMS